MEWQKYKEATDEQLVSRLQAGEPEVMEYLIAKYKFLVRKRANALYLIGGDTEDLIQEGMLGLFKAVRDYRADKDASFAHFAELCINRQLYSAVEASRRKKHTPLNSYIPLDAPAAEQTDSVYQQIEDKLQSPDPEALVIGQEELRLLVQRLKERLSPMERRVLSLYLDGMSYHQIAECMGKSPKAIDNALQRIRGKVRV